MENLKDLKMGELRELYPSIKAISKADFIEQVEEKERVVLDTATEEVTVSGEDFSTLNNDNVLLYIASQIQSQNKILIKCEDSLTADDIFLMAQYNLFPKLNEKGISVLASSTRRDMSLNGTCYVRIVCKRNHDHLKRLMIYNVFKELV